MHLRERVNIADVRGWLFLHFALINHRGHKGAQRKNVRAKLRILQIRGSLRTRV